MKKIWFIRLIIALEAVFFLSVGVSAAAYAESMGKKKAQIEILTNMSMRGLSEVIVNGNTHS